MKIYFVRHGHPDYRNDCLTELGMQHAKLAAERLKNCGIEQIFSSTCGRALQTAQQTAELLGLPVIPCDFMREIACGTADEEPILENGNPWNIAPIFANEGRSLCDAHWQETEPFCRSRVVPSAKIVISGVDAWLEELGYRREGEYYRVTGEHTDMTVAMFGHGGSFSVTLSHLFNIPFVQFCGAVHIDFTGIVTLELSNERGNLVYPKWITLDASHINGFEAQSFYGN